MLQGRLDTSQQNSHNRSIQRLVKKKKRMKNKLCPTKILRKSRWVEEKSNGRSEIIYCKEQVALVTRWGKIAFSASCSASSDTQCSPVKSLLQKLRQIALVHQTEIIYLSQPQHNRNLNCSQSWKNSRAARACSWNAWEHPKEQSSPNIKSDLPLYC